MSFAFRALISPCLLALAALAPAASQASTVTKYNATWNDPYQSGYFWADDLNGDRTITTDEVNDFEITFNNANGGPGAFYWTTKTVKDLLFTMFPDSHGLLSGTANVVYRYYYRNPAYNDPRCGHGTLGYTNNDYEMKSVDVPFLAIDATYVASVPLPAAASLLAGGLAGLAALGRRRRAA